MSAQLEPAELVRQAKRFRGMACELRSHLENLQNDAESAYNAAPIGTPEETFLREIMAHLEEAAMAAGETESLMDEHFPDPEEEPAA